MDGSANGNGRGESIVAGSLEQLLGRMPEECATMATRPQQKAGDVLLRMGDNAEYVFFLLHGRIASINEQFGGLQYHYASFVAPAVFGEFEAFADVPVYRSTLTCETDCRFLRLNRSAYLSWMRSDADALFQRTCAITASLVVQARQGRDSLFCSAEERLAAYIIMRCRQSVPVEDEYTLKQTLQQMADGIGSSVRTVQRALKHLVEMAFVQRQSRGVLISERDLLRLTEWSETITRKEEKKP